MKEEKRRREEEEERREEKRATMKDGKFETSDGGQFF
jgi:hypothetical protein